jgi:hypothetical protein
LQKIKLPPSPSPIKRGLTVYDGQTKLSVIIDRACGFEAVTPGNVSLGRSFPSSALAATALWQHAIKQQRRAS